MIVRKVLTGRSRRAVPGEGPLALLAHFGYGGSCGALFALLTRRRDAGVPLGVTYALLLWGIGYAGWVPPLVYWPRPTATTRDGSAP